MNLDTSRMSLGARSGAYLLRDEPASAFIVHTTGSGPHRRATAAKYARWRKRWGVTYGDDYLAALALYRFIMKAGPHFVVCGASGRAAQVCPEDLCAWHVGGRGFRRYRSKWWRHDPEFEWWVRQFPELNDPRELAGGELWEPYKTPPGLSLDRARARLVAAYEGGTCNGNTVAVEVVPIPGQSTINPCAVRVVCEIFESVQQGHGFPREPDRLLSHSEAHPIARTSRGRAWDPKPEVMRQIRAEAGLSLA